MRWMAQFALATALLMGGATLAMAQNGPATGGYPPAGENPNFYGSRSTYDYYDYDGPRYGHPYRGRPQYRLGSPVPSYGNWGWRDW